MRNYGVDGFQNDPLKNRKNNSGYYEQGGSGVLGFFDDMIGQIFFNDPDASGSIFGELTGYNAQQREFEQQEYLLEKQWEHDSYAAQMARAKAAGINPNLAAQGIVGGNVSAQPASVSSNTSGAAGAVNALSGVANAITGGKASLAEAAFKDGTLQPTIDNLRNEALEHLANYGLTDAQRQSAENYLKYVDEDQYLDIQMKRVNVKRYKQELKNAKSMHDSIVSQTRLTDEQYNLILAQEGEVAARKAKIEAEEAAIKEETRYQTWLNNWAIEHNIRRDSNTFDAVYSDLLMSDGDAEGFCGDFVTFYEKKKKAEADAEQQAIESHTYAIEKARRDGQNVSDVLYGRVGSWGDALGRVARDAGNNIQNIQDNIIAAFKSGGVNKQGREIRKELTMVLNNAFEALDKYPEDANHYQEVISEMQAALQLSNKELVEWFNKSNN